jgi:hypothetical protein
MTVFYESRSGPRATELSAPSGNVFRDFETSPLGYTADIITVVQDPLQKGQWSFKVEI